MQQYREKSCAKDKQLIKKEDIPAIKDIISEFYNDTWSGIRIELKLADKQYETKRKAIISELVVSGKRNLVLKSLLIIDGNEQDENIIRALVSEGMLRKIPSGKDVFYQVFQLPADHPAFRGCKETRSKRKCTERD